MKAYRFNKLVYIPVYKNASSTYEEVFDKMLNWETMLTDDIDWEQDIVFSYISNPYHRHLRGTLQFLIIADLISVLDDPKLGMLLSSGYLDNHSYPITLMFGHNAQKIIWLPIDHPEMSSAKITCSFLQRHGILLAEDQIPHLHQSSPDKLLLLDRIKKIAESNDYTNNGLYFILDQDMQLYTSALQNVNNNY
jgi:hypothetical protein